MGAIERRVALLTPAAARRRAERFAEVTLDRQGAEHLAAFEARAVAEAAVQQCCARPPGAGLHAGWSSCADMPAWHALVQRLFTQDANVRNVKSYFSVHRAKFETRISLPAAR